MLTHWILVPTSLQKGCLHRYLVCVSIGLKCWKFWRGGVLFRQLGGCRYYYPSRDVGFLVCRLPFRQVLVCLHISWFEVLEVLEGERCLGRCVADYHPSRDAGFLVCPPVGFVVNTVVTSGGSTIL